jgi:peptide/nickel transport system substrate-binding protein
LAAALTAVAQTNATPAATRGTLRFAVAAEPLTLDPLLETATSDDDIFALFCDLLVVTDASGKTSPLLAARVPTLANGDISRDGRSITYHLRRGVRWHDGYPFTSNDVRFSWQAVMNPRNNLSSRAGYDQVERVDVPDDYTAIFRLKQPYAPAVLMLFGGGQTARLIPEHLLGNAPSLNQLDFNQRPIGTGPFKVVSWKRGDSLELAANDTYFLGKPKLSSISIRFVPSLTTAALMLRTRETDLAQLDSEGYRELRSDPAVRVVLAPYNAVLALQLNVTRPALRDVRVRRALAYAIDRRALVEKNTFGTGEVADGDIGPISWAHTDDVVHYAYDPAKARALLEQAGWKIASDGIRSKAGRRLSLELVEVAGTTTGHNEDVQIQQMLAAVGVELAIKPFSESLLFAPPVEGGILAAGRFDIASGGSVTGPDPDNSAVYRCAAVAPAGQNFSRYCNPALDALERRAVASYDPQVRKQAYAGIERILANDVPSIFLYWPKARYGMSPALRGFAPNGVTTTWNAYTWSFSN